MNIIEAYELTKNYDHRTVVDKISFEVREGEIFGFLGSNGAGKTTTIRMLSTIIAPSSGNGKVDGHDLLKDARRIRNSIALVPQGSFLNPVFSVKHNLLIYILLRGYSLKAAQVKTRQALEKFGLESFADFRMWQLSGGYRKRVQLARTLSCESKIVFLDEPTVGLDPYARHQIWEEICEAKSAGCTIFLTTQSMEEAEQLCDRVGFLNKGKLIEVNDIERLKQLYGEKRITLTLKENTNEKGLEELSKLLTQIDPRGVVDKANCQIMLSQLDSVSMVMEFLVKNEITVSDINSESGNLEQIYFKLMGNGTK